MPLVECGLQVQVPRTCEAASWEPNEVYEVLHETSVISEEGQEETFNRLLKPAAPPDSGNGVRSWCPMRA